MNIYIKNFYYDKLVKITEIIDKEILSLDKSEKKDVMVDYELKALELLLKDLESLRCKRNGVWDD